MGVSLFTGTIFCLPKSNQTIMCGPEEALADSNKCGQLPLSQGAWSLRCRNSLIRESRASFSQCLGGAYTRAKPRTQLMKTAKRCSSLCRKAWRWRPQLSLYQCIQCQVQWLHATGQFPQQVLEQLSLPRQRLWHRQSFRWWKHPSKPQAVGSARGLSLTPGEMAFCSAGGVPSWTSCPFKWRSYGRKWAVCTASESMKGR